MSEEMSETAIVNVCLSYLKIAGHHVWRNNSGFFKHDYTTVGGQHRRSVMRAGIKGSSDIIGICKYDGKFIAVECKRRGNVTTTAQDEFLDEVKKRGGYAVVAYGVADLQNAGLLEGVSIQ